MIGEDLGLETAGIGERVASLKTQIVDDGRFRLAVAGLETERKYSLIMQGTRCG